MYEVHPDNKDQWILYEVGHGELIVVGWFPDKADADFAREAFERRQVSSPSIACGVPDIATHSGTKT